MQVSRTLVSVLVTLPIQAVSLAPSAGLVPASLSWYPRRQTAPSPAARRVFHCCYHSQSDNAMEQEARNEDAASEPTASPPNKFHHLTVCLVPPDVPNNQHVWEQLTQARTDLRDPGLFRWPPHANLLYPFVDPRRAAAEDEPDKNNPSSRMDPEILDKLQGACRQMEPFTVRLERLGTFGSAKRGVLWMYPTSRVTTSTLSTVNDTEPLIQLQALLQDAFPFCNDQQKVAGTFHPHMTLSHFVNLDEALQAQAKVETWWDTSLDFRVDEIYLLHRQGDGGQFERLVTVGLGSKGTVTVHDPSLPFDSMPHTEADWVREERMKLKQRRNYKGSRRGGRGRRRRGGSRPPPDSPEVIAQKRAERKAKRESHTNLL